MATRPHVEPLGRRLATISSVSIPSPSSHSVTPLAIVLGIHRRDHFSANQTIGSPALRANSRFIRLVARRRTSIVCETAHIQARPRRNKRQTKLKETIHPSLRNEPEQSHVFSLVSPICGNIVISSADLVPSACRSPWHLRARTSDRSYSVLPMRASMRGSAANGWPCTASHRKSAECDASVDALAEPRQLPARWRMSR